MHGHNYFIIGILLFIIFYRDKAPAPPATNIPVNIFLRKCSQSKTFPSLCTCYSNCNDVAKEAEQGSGAVFRFGNHPLKWSRNVLSYQQASAWHKNRGKPGPKNIPSFFRQTTFQTFRFCHSNDKTPNNNFCTSF